MIIQYMFDTDKEGFDYTELEAVQQAQRMAFVLNSILETFRDWTKYNAFPRKAKIKEGGCILEEQKEYAKDLNAFIDKYPDVIPDIWEMKDQINSILSEAGVNMERLGY